MIIDCHAHVFLAPKILANKYVKTTFMSVEDQIAFMDAKGVDKAIILPLNGAETPVECQSMGEILEICKMYPDRFIPFCNIDPRLAKHPDKIEVADYIFLLDQYKQLGCKGVGEMVVRMPWENPLMQMFLEACQHVGLAITFHTITEDFDGYGVIDDLGLHGLEKCLSKFPKLKFFGHSTAFWSEISADVNAETKHQYPTGKVTPEGRVAELMRKYPNLYGDLSANSGLCALTRDPEYAYKFIEEFQDRLMLGFDACSVINELNHVEWFKAARDDKKISEAAYEKIMWKNVNDALDLGIV